MADYDEMVLDGHGGWNPRDNPAFAQVPRGTTIKFLTGNFKIMMKTVVTDEDSALDLLQQFRDAAPNQEGTEFSTVPNYVLSEMTEDSSQVPEWVYQVHGDTPLCTNDGSDPKIVCGSGIHRCNGIFADDAVVGATLYWGACRYVHMDHVGSPEFYAASGVNERQPDMGLAGQSNVVISNDTTDMWLNQIDSLSGDPDALEAWLEKVRAALTTDQLTMVRDRLDERFPDWEASKVAAAASPTATPTPSGTPSPTP